MKLLLTSQGFHENGKLIFDEMVRLVNKRADEIKIKLFSVIESDLHRSFVDGDIALINSLGIPKENIGHINICENIPQDALQDLDVLYMCGGNTYQVLYLLKRGGYVSPILDFISKGGVYVGQSAGSTICGPDIDIAGIMDGDANDVNLKDTSGFGLIDFCIAPHYEDRYYEELMDFKKHYAYRFTALTNSQAISIDGNYMKFIF